MKRIFLLVAFLAFTNFFGSSKSHFDGHLTSEFLCDCKEFKLDSAVIIENNVLCFRIPVDKDYKNTSLEKYYLATILVPSFKDSELSPLLYLHGGPGIATLGNIEKYLKSPTWKLIREERDLIFFDYRGTGYSEPEMCNFIQDSLNSYYNKNPSQEAIAQKEISLYKDCKNTLLGQGIQPGDFTTQNLANDVEEIRKALDISEWNLYGVSYGTNVALNLLKYFPNNIKSVILDSPFPPNAPWNDFVRPFDTCFKTLENKILKDSVYHKIFPSIRNDFVDAVKRLNTKPSLITFERNGGKFDYYFTGDDLAWSIWSAMLNPTTIPFVPLTIKEIAAGKDSILLDWSMSFSSADAFGKFSAAQNYAILCFENRPRSVQDTEESLTLEYPDFASFNTGINEELCDIWRPETVDDKIFLPVRSEVPILILAGEFDPVCPPLFGAIAAETLKNSTLIIVPDASHAAIHADECIRTIAYDFLKNPETIPNIDCVKLREAIIFIIKDLVSALKNYQKK